MDWERVVEFGRAWLSGVGWSERDEPELADWIRLVGRSSEVRTQAHRVCDLVVET